MADEVKILGINGSPNKNGTCFKLLSGALEQSRKEGASADIVHLADHEKHFFHGRYTKEIPDGVRDLFNMVQKADGIIFTTPVHWFNVSALMKNFIDQLTVLELDNFALETKVASFMSVAEEDGGMQAILQMAAPLNQMGMIIPPHAMFFYNKNMADKSEDGWMDREARLIGGNIVKAVRLTNVDEYFWDYTRLK